MQMVMDAERELHEFARQVLELTLRVRDEYGADDSPAVAKLLLVALGVLERSGQASEPVSGERAIFAPESAVELVLARNRRRRR